MVEQYPFKVLVEGSSPSQPTASKGTTGQSPRDSAGVMKLLSLPAITISLAFTACDSKQEQAREQALENRADRLEDQARATKDAAESNADAEKKAAAAQAEALKKEADRTREQK